jgi:exodeoxyribonuclease V gamma subunit
VIVLMGLDGDVFPRRRERPGFHLLEGQRRLGDPSPADQDRYVLLESLLSARQHLLITWSSRDSRTGEELMPSTPVRQWLALLEQELGRSAMAGLLREPAANPLERRNFLPEGERSPICSDRRLLRARRLLEADRPAPPRPLAATAGAPGEARDAPAPAPPEAAQSDLLAWLQAPQETWLESLGLRPKERAEPVIDLEPLSLGEQERARLLREGLTRTPPLPAGAAPDWLLEQRGRGILPAGAAGEMEAARLELRWRSLQEVLVDLGEARQAEATLSWRGDRLAEIHTARPQPAQRLVLWQALLLACAAGQRPREGVLVGREDDRFRVLETLAPLPAEQAAAELEALRELREQHRHRCWPVPPRTGWAWAEAELRQPGRGFRAALDAWEGGFSGFGERQREVMALCFGGATTTRELLDPGFCRGALALLTPLLERREVVKGGGRRG